MTLHVFECPYFWDLTCSFHETGRVAVVVYLYRLDGRYSPVGEKYRSMPGHISGQLRIAGGRLKVRLLVTIPTIRARLRRKTRSQPWCPLPTSRN